MIAILVMLVVWTFIVLMSMNCGDPQYSLVAGSTVEYCK